MDHPEPHELGVLEPGNQPQHARLLAPLHLRLEADEAEVVAGQVVLPELDARIRLAAGARIGQAHRLHRPEPQRIDAAPRHHLDRQAPLEELRVVELVQRRLLGRHDRVVKCCVLVPGQRTVQVVPIPVVHATAELGDTHRLRLSRLRRAARGPRRAVGAALRMLRPQREARKTFAMSIDSARTIGLIAS